MSGWTDTCAPVVIKFSVEKLLENGYALMPYSDPVWGEGECDWEREVRIEGDILSAPRCFGEL
jgi:hypothetical protein